MTVNNSQLTISQSYVTTDGHLPLYLFSSPIWDPRPDFCCCQTAAGLLIWGVLMRGRVYRLQLLLILAREVFPRFDSRGTNEHISLHKIRDSPNPEDQVPVFISHINRVAQLYSQAMSFLFVVLYDSQGCAVGIRTRIHTGYYSES
jgi:hypothetical protein